MRGFKRIDPFCPIAGESVMLEERLLPETPVQLASGVRGVTFGNRGLSWIVRRFKAMRDLMKNSAYRNPKGHSD